MLGIKKSIFPKCIHTESWSVALTPLCCCRMESQLDSDSPRGDGCLSSAQVKLFDGLDPLWDTGVPWSRVPTLQLCVCSCVCVCVCLLNVTITFSALVL